jgi:hypothetical protein
MLTRLHVECDAVENYCTITCDCHYILFYGRNIHDDNGILCNTMQFFFIPVHVHSSLVAGKIGRLGGFRKAFQGLRWLLVNDFRNTVISIEQKMSVI